MFNLILVDSTETNTIDEQQSQTNITFLLPFRDMRQTFSYLTEHLIQ